ncbi:rasGAP-activating-like protein 1 isoform X1 [Parus major]|uniref:rasGAP-activating-like protein 1 isoform X1 n=1 Tax=Parus major TaxID=9157 RepID=UPI0014440F14|nr:rasGAP-activating-like protein 1 isoform X1 [Parus major]
MAKTTSLRCRVLEGKDLPAKDVSGSSDPYCVVKVDNEVVARTATVWKSLNPFWGEEITLLLPRGFHSLTIYVLDEDTIGQDDVIGKVSLSHQQISAEPRGIDSWLSLAPVNPDQEVQGEIHLELRVPEQGHPRVLRCHLIQARDLAPRDPSGTSDPFGRVSCCGHTLETAVVKRSRFPHWDEVLEFELPEGELGEAALSVEVWDWDIVGKNDFLGRVEFCLDTLCPGPTRGWFQLLPFPSTTKDRGGHLGALRLAVRLLEDTVLPSHHYQPLIQLLTEPILCPAQSPEGTALAVLEEVTSGESRQDVATKLVKIFLGQGLAVPLLDFLTTRELARTTDPNTLFRSNSLASKSMEHFMKVVGLPYLHGVLKPVVNRVFEEKKYVELDPGKMELSRGRRISFKGSLSEAQVRESSLELLKGYLGDIIDAIVGSVDECPLPMRVVFKQLRRRAEERFPSAQHEEVRYFSISGFLFLRFFAPAVLTPKLFGLREQHAEPCTGRTLLLLAKALQTIGNLGLQLGQGKEPWMAPLNSVLLPSVTRVRAFLDALVTVESPEVGEVPVPQGHPQPSATIKEGPLHTCPERGVTLLPRFAFKKRHFRLSSQALAYAKVPQGQELCSIPVEQIRAVEQVDKGTFQHPHVLQVVAQDDTGQLHTTYLQCKVGDPTLPSTPKSPGTPHHNALGPPSPAASQGHPQGTMGMIPNPAVPGTCCTGSAGSAEVEELTGYTGEAGVFYPGCTGVTGVPALFTPGTLVYPGSCSTISPHFLPGSCATKLSLLSPSLGAHPFLLPPPPPRHWQCPARGVPVPAVPAELPGAVAVAVGAAPGHQRQQGHAAHLPPRHIPRRPLDLLPAAHPCRARVQPHPRHGGAGRVERPRGCRGGSTEPLRSPAVSPGGPGGLLGAAGQRGKLLRVPVPLSQWLVVPTCGS